jgi:thioredoxin-related protein
MEGKKTTETVYCKEGMTLELLSEYNESIGKYYKVEGIPRFMIFDKEGKIVTVDSPRPSDPQLESLIEQTLQSSDVK